MSGTQAVEFNKHTFICKSLSLSQKKTEITRFQKLFSKELGNVNINNAQIMMNANGDEAICVNFDGQKKIFTLFANRASDKFMKWIGKHIAHSKDFYPSQKAGGLQTNFLGAIDFNGDGIAQDVRDPRSKQITYKETGHHFFRDGWVKKGQDSGTILIVDPDLITQLNVK